MSCPSCVGHLDDTLRVIAGVTEVEVQLENGKIVVEYDAQRASLDRLVSAVKDAGYEAAEGLS